MINHSSIYHFSIISAYYYWGCTFTSAAQARLDLTLGEHLSAKSLKSLRAWILTTGEAAVDLEASRGTRHNSCERKQKQHNLISSPDCPLRSSLQTQGSSSPMKEKGRRLVEGTVGKRLEQDCPEACAALAVMWYCLYSPCRSTPHVAMLQFPALPCVPPCKHKPLWHLLSSRNPRKFVPHLLQQDWSEGIKQIQR